MTASNDMFEAKEPVTYASAVEGEKMKLSDSHSSQQLPESLKETGRVFNVTESDLLEAKHLASTFTLEQTIRMMKKVHKQHARDPNFPIEIINHIDEFIDNEDDMVANPQDHEHAIEEMKIQAALMTNNSPYAEVRAVVDNHDDPSLPVSTIRAWAMGICFCFIIASVNSFFDIRLPSVSISGTVVQLLAYPLGTFLARVLPDKGFTLAGVRHSLNPGPFNKKEHMLITIMASVSGSVPYTNYIAWIQVLPSYFGQQWAQSIAYQLLIGLSTNFIGYGMAGLARRFLVYPAHCVWPGALVTIALNSAFHDKSGEPNGVAGPFKSRWTVSRMKYFFWAGGLMFAYFWLPNYLFAGLSYFSWISWISPTDVNLASITGGQTGLGLNPVPTLDWNILAGTVDPLMVPFFSTFNLFLGGFFSMFVIIAIYYTNTYNTAYLPINSNRPFDHFGNIYQVRSIVDENGIFNAEKYQAYSPPYLAASNIVVYMLFFGLYSSTVTYAILYHRLEIKLGLQDMWANAKLSLRRWRTKDARDQESNEEDVDLLDVHNRLMRAYPEVPQWWYMTCLVIAVAIGMVGIALWPTNTTPFVVLYGIALCLVFVVPIGIIGAMTGVFVTLNVIAEFIGGVWMEGNAIGMCFFKSYGYVTCAHALSFSSDLKLAHYIKIPPRFTFWAQMVPTFLSTIISVAILQYQTRIENVCTTDAPFRFFCPGVNTFFTAAVFWGTVGPRKIWGVGGQYALTLLGFPFGFIVVMVFWYLNKKWPKSAILRNAHPVVMLNGALNWAPTNLAYIWPSVPISALSWLLVKKRYLDFWSKYNYVTSAAFTCGIALSSILMFFGLQVWNIKVHWWGTEIVDTGCDGVGNCTLLSLPNGEYFGPRLGEFS
ncbi:putative oligopeptide transporter [Cercophora samala]|uniref:Oligopeptide transporter n=1 Tax=Cercophora samala TaxID=330535 RepID=A0AA40D1N2_9PEZI|nr:putative oligopeptide transporter [Cercophora samala]